MHDNIVGLNASMGGGDVGCWLCAQSLATRALFCHQCGTIQPVRALDHFTRLGLSRNLDIDMDLLDRNYNALCRTLDPARFGGLGERGHVTAQREALNEAYDALRDPLRRGRYWLSIHDGGGVGESNLASLVEKFRHELSQVTVAGDFDSIAQRAGQALQDGVTGVMQALRSKAWGQARALLADLEGLEGIAQTARAGRTAMKPQGEISALVEVE